jgi:hypothetical protein
VSRYAANTSVSSEKSRHEIERTLTRYGASKFMYGWDSDGAVIAFIAHDRYIRFKLPLPDKQAHEFTHHTRGRRTEIEIEKRWEQATRQRWRALTLVVKAKLEAVESGIAEFEDEFLAYIVIPQTNETLGETMRPQLADAYANLNVPPQLALPVASS